MLFPLWSYVRHYEDLWTPAFEHYMAAFERHHGHQLEFRRGEVVLDIGAHTGTFCIPLARQFDGVKIFALEPDRENADFLRRNAQINNIEDTRLIVDVRGVHDSEGEVLFLKGDATTRGSVSNVGFFKSSLRAETTRVRVTTVHKLFEEYKLTFLKLAKVDCEGCEYGILDGEGRILLENAENLAIEIHPTDDRDPESLRQLIIGCGFSVGTDRLSNGCIELFCKNTNFTSKEGRKSIMQ